MLLAFKTHKVRFHLLFITIVVQFRPKIKSSFRAFGSILSPIDHVFRSSLKWTVFVKMDCSLGFNLTLHFDTNDRPVWLIIPSTFISLGRSVSTWLTFFQLTSALCMIAVSIDRAILIYLSRPLTRNQAWGVCVGIWILSYTITIPTLIHSKVHNQNKYKEQVISRDPQWSEIFLRKPPSSESTWFLRNLIDSCSWTMIFCGILLRNHKIIPITWYYNLIKRLH